jgi:hypothetical protein
MFRRKQKMEEDESKTIVVKFDKDNKLLGTISKNEEKLIINNISNKSRQTIKDLQNAIELLNSKFLFEKKNLYDLRGEITKRKDLLLKTDDEILYQCKICYENIIDTVIPCGHVFCNKCAHSNKDGDDLICPLCRTIITGSKKIYVS